MKLSTKHLVPGMRLLRPVYGPKGELLLGKGITLTARYIMLLRQYEILAVNVEVAGSREIEESQETIEDEVRLNAMRTLNQTIRAGKLTADNYHRLVETMEEIIEEILSGKNVTCNLTEICSADAYTFAHSVDVGILSIAIGAKLGYKRKGLLKLGTGGILHDLGKTEVPSEILNKPGKLTSEEFAVIKKHPAYGYKLILESASRIDPQSAAIILNHHERWDGSGYPRGLKGEDLDEMDSICAIADVYNAMTTDRVYRPALPPHEAYEMLMAAGNIMFSAKVVEAFMQCVVPYPVGAFVKLSNNETAVVYKLNAGLPFRPRIKIIATGEEVDLVKERSLVITGLVRQEEIKTLMANDKDGGKHVFSTPAGGIAGNY